MKNETQDSYPSLSSLYANHQGKASDKWESYLTTYDEIFHSYRNQPLHLLEIGIQNGGSLEIWSQYFKSAKQIIGCDINPLCQTLKFEDSRIRIVIGDINQNETISTLNKISSSFTIIIDDGSHKSSDIIRTFINLFPHLEMGGTYIIEDLHCSYYPKFEGGLFNNLSSMQFLMRLADFINKEHWGISLDNKEYFDLLNQHYEFQSQWSDELFSSIHSIEFKNSLSIIKKKPNSKNILGKRIVIGKDTTISNDLLLNNKIIDHPVFERTQILDPSPFLQIQKIKSDQEKKIAHFSSLLDLRTSELETVKRVLDEKDHKISDLSNLLDLNEKRIIDLRQMNHDLEGRLTLLNESIRSLKQSTSYQLTRPLRAIGNFLPLSVKRGIRRSVKLLYWGMTPHRMGDRIKKYRLGKLKRRIQFEVLFDRNWYLKQYPDVANSLEDPLDHYLLYGAREGRDPNPLFDTDWYLNQNPDVKESGTNSLQHFIEYGAREGRDPNPLFDTDWYLNQNPDVKESGTNPLQHFIEYGAREGRKINPINNANYPLWIQNYDTLTDADRVVFRKAMEGL